jgi:phytoene desaturase
VGSAGGVDGPHHQIFLPSEPRAAYAQLDAGTLPDEPLVYCCNPAISDGTVAPANTAALMLLAVVPHRGVLPELDEERYFERVLAVAEQRLGPLRAHIAYQRTRGPAAFERELGLAYGAAFGPDHLLDQMGPFRAPIRHRTLANLAFAGSGTHPGSGIPMVLLSGRLAARRLLGGPA